MSKRRTLQSGYSLMSRGEPKIWLTGGMLVICLLMILSLLSLIIINGLSTFWPGPVHWLVLQTNELDIGEPQRQEVRPNEKNSVANAPSYFYRTANFDVTNRHYRWFAPEELSSQGIVVPDWALVIERLAWGRMYALPARLSLPVRASDDDPSGQRLDQLLSCQALLNELAGELQTTASTEPALPLDQMQAALAEQITKTRTEVLQALTKQAVEAKLAAVQVQPEENGPWQTADSSQADTLFAVRQVIDQPEQILSRLERLLIQLAEARRESEHLMHRISTLDGKLSEARVAVRQAELDTGKTALDKIDTVGSLIDGMVVQARTLKRIQDTAKAAGRLFTDQDLATKFETLLSRHETQNLLPMIEAFKSELQTWQQQFADAPPQIQSAVREFAEVWQSVQEDKAPLEEQIRIIELSSAGYELNVLVPTDALALEMSPEDSQALLSGKWTEAARAVLNAQSVQPSDSAPRVTQVTPEIKLVQFDTISSGSIVLWHVQRPSAAPAWLLPQQKAINCNEIVRLFPANRLTLAGKFGVYCSRWREFLLDNPREGNTEGGVFPAIWGTVVMTLIMTLAVVPFGVIAALYLREYTRSGPIVSLVRISINNLAGVPSIVYGVFGLAFFCYSMGAFIDGGARNAQFGVLPTNTWYLLLAGTVVIGVLAFMFSLMSGGRDRSTNLWKRWMASLAPLAWLLSLVGIGVLVFKSPFFDGLYEARLPAPTFGKEGLLWASLTLALLTLPVVIVATEEALSAVPNSLREGSLACGASKWQTIYRIVLPHARPGILTGAILAMARGIGEVAPLMLVGALPVAPDLPLDSEFPYFHGSRSFMHLGYQIYWLGFQSQNSEASKPLVFTCTLLLILIVISLNLSAILLRARLRKRFMGNQF